MHFLKLKTSLLALYFSVMAELAFSAIFFSFRSFTYFGDPLNFVSRAYFWFHVWMFEMVNEVLLPDWMQVWNDNLFFQAAGFTLLIGVALLQWYIVFLPSISLFRFLSRKFSRTAA